MKLTIPSVFALCPLLLAFPAAAEVFLHIEQVNGDFSDDRFNPTPLVLPTDDGGVVLGRLEGIQPDDTFDIDYYSITIPAGFQLTQIVLQDYLSQDFAAFLGIQPGPIFPNDPATVQPQDLLGWIHFGPGEIGTNMLPMMGQNGYGGGGMPGFTTPLTGTYTLWVQQNGEFTEYNALFLVEPIPAPAGGGLVVMGLLAVGRRPVRARA